MATACQKLEYLRQRRLFGFCAQTIGDCFPILVLAIGDCHMFRLIELCCVAFPIILEEKHLQLSGTAQQNHECWIPFKPANQK